MPDLPSHLAASAEAPEPTPAAARMLARNIRIAYKFALDWDVNDQGRDAARRIAEGMEDWEAWFGAGSWYADRRRRGQAGAGKE